MPTLNATLPELEEIQNSSPSGSSAPSVSSSGAVVYDGPLGQFPGVAGRRCLLYLECLWRGEPEIAIESTGYLHHVGVIHASNLADGCALLIGVEADALQMVMDRYSEPFGLAHRWQFDGEVFRRYLIGSPPPEESRSRVSDELLQAALRQPTSKLTPSLSGKFNLAVRQIF